MKLMIASDIHGSLYYCRLLEEAYRREKADKLLLLGDLLYDGPRNSPPREYDPRGVYRLLNSMKSEILCVRGNCDSDTDQSVLEFPMQESIVFFLEGRMVYATHGHRWGLDNPPMLKPGDALLQGHTHLLAAQDKGDFVYLNPGSVSIPFNNNPSSYMVYEDGLFEVRRLEGGEPIIAHRMS